MRTQFNPHFGVVGHEGRVMIGAFCQLTDGSEKTHGCSEAAKRPFFEDQGLGIVNMPTVEAFQVF
jgi:hypothetical protein